MYRLLIILFCFVITIPAHADPLPQLNYSDFSKIPVLHNGRVKPLDSFARIHLQILSGKQSLPNMEAAPWLAELILSPEEARARKVFYISNPDILSLFELEKRKKYLYSFEEVFELVLLHLGNIEAIYDNPEAQRSTSEEQMLLLHEKVLYYLDISRSLSMILPDFIPSSSALARILKSDTGKALTYLQIFPRQGEIKAGIQPLITNIENNLSNISSDDVEAMMFAYRIKEIEQEHNSRLFRVIPSQWDMEENLWFTPWELFDRGQGSPQAVEFLEQWTKLSSAYRRDDAEEFSFLSKAIQSAALSMAGSGTDDWLMTLEEKYNHWNLFKLSLVFYIASFLLLLSGGLFWRQRLYNLSFISLLIAAGLHLSGILMRMNIMGRPPVTNLYESILFVGLVAVVFGLIMEWRRKDGIGLMVGSICGVILQFLGIRYAVDGDTMGMLQAVLDTNFWLATHVVTITIGYGSCFVAGLIAHIYFYYRIIKPDNKKQLKALSANIRGVALVALFFSVLGTILGGIWADQSWGRFWGWDPKENGALLICLWLIWLIHGRLGGIIREDGFAIGMIINNVIVALAWFGVNLLGVGLHSYGFTNGVAFNLFLFSGIEILIAATFYALIKKQPPLRDCS